MMLRNHSAATYEIGREITEISNSSPNYPVELGNYFAARSPKLWCIGDQTILKKELLGVVSARMSDPDLAMKASTLLSDSGASEGAFISGWHSPLEKEALHVLLTQPAKIVFCTAKSLTSISPSPEIKDLIARGGALLLTHCGPKAKRISRDASLRRNELVLGLSRTLLVLSAPEDSSSFKLAVRALGTGRRVFVIEHPMNRDLLNSGALPASVETLGKFFL